MLVLTVAVHRRACDLAAGFASCQCCIVSILCGRRSPVNPGSEHHCNFHADLDQRSRCV